MTRLYRAYLALTLCLGLAALALTLITTTPDEPDFTDSGVGCTTDCLDSN